MPFVKTTWQPGRAGGTQFTAAQMNRIEQGIADAFGTTQAITNAQAISFQGLDGESDVAYEFSFFGRISGNTVDHALILRPNNDTTGANYSTTTMWRWWQDPVGTAMSGVLLTTGTPTGIQLAQTHFSVGGAFFIRARVFAATGQKRPVTSDYTFIRSDADARHLRGLPYGHWSDTASAVNRIDVALVKAAASFPAPEVAAVLNGRAVLRRLTV